MRLRQFVHFRIELGFVFDRRVCGFPLVEDLHRGTVRHGVLQFVLVDVVAKSLGGLLLVLGHDQRGARECQPSGMGKRLKHVVPHVARLRAMSFVDHKQNSLGRIDHTERLIHGNLSQHFIQIVRPVLSLTLLELVDHDHVQIGRVRRQLGLQVIGTGNERDLLARQRRRFAQLFFEVCAVVDEADFEILQVVAHPQLSDDEHHRQALAASLSMPNNAGAIIRRLASAKPVDDFADGSILLVTSDHLHSGLAGVHEQRAGPHEIQQRLFRQHPLDEHFLLPFFVERRLVLPELLREDVVPRKEELFVGRSDRAELSFVAAGADQQLIGVEQSWLAFSQPFVFCLFSLIAVPHQLPERFLHRVGREVVGVFAFDDHQRQTVHEQHDVRDDEVLA